MKGWFNKVDKNLIIRGNSNGKKNDKSQKVNYELEWIRKRENIFLTLAHFSAIVAECKPPQTNQKPLPIFAQTLTAVGAYLTNEGWCANVVPLF